jgi:hypothetical protein
MYNIKIKVMEKRKNKVLSGLMILGLVMSSLQSYAGVGEKFNKFIGSEFTNISGLYIILGVIAAGIIGKVLHHFFIKEEEKAPSNVKIGQHVHHRHHRPRSIVKKTS